MVVESRDPAVAFAEYAQQRLGIPWPTQKDIIVLRRGVKDVFANCPGTDWYSICRLVDWASARNRRYKRVWALVHDFRDAWHDHYLPELNRPLVQGDVESAIRAALDVETDPRWRRQLLGVQGSDARAAVLADWRAQRGRHG